MIPCPWDAKVYELMIRANYLTSYKCATRRTSTSVCLSFKKKKKLIATSSFVVLPQKGRQRPKALNHVETKSTETPKI